MDNSSKVDVATKTNIDNIIEQITQVQACALIHSRFSDYEVFLRIVEQYSAGAFYSDTNTTCIGCGDPTEVLDKEHIIKTIEEHFDPKHYSIKFDGSHIYVYSTLIANASLVAQTTVIEGYDLNLTGLEVFFKIIDNSSDLEYRDLENNEIQLLCFLVHNDHRRSVSEIKKKLLDESTDKCKFNYMSVSVDGEINVRRVVREMKLAIDEYLFKLHYPYLDWSSIKEWWENFRDARETCTLFIGPPGTGKSELISSILAFQQWKNVSLGDSKHLFRHVELVNMIQHHIERGIFVAEDCDALVRKRDDGNDIMTSLLGLTEGLMKTSGKFIFSTNLPSTKDVDTALIRPGRCHSVVRFKKLTYEQASKVWEHHNPTKTFDTKGRTEFTLSEAINGVYDDDDSKVGFH